ncbi:MAG: NRDE family protein [Flavobacterium sp.]|jgi:uncharacterized protein with NRDE domain|nr:NRDE family protein [Flavobacterium sp.]
MCTVTYVSTNSKVIITSNRDEKVLRQKAILPKDYLINGKKITFPKDPKAGGTWFAVAEEGTISVLLNGANEKHELREKYRKSRGLIVLDIISAENPLLEWEMIDLEGIEPFTIVLFHQNKLYQAQWDEISKTLAALNANENYIWSSSTLYSQNVRSQRSKWFNEFIENNSSLNEESMMHFHRYTMEDNTEFGLVINRNDLLKTLSITQTVIENNRLTLTHVDLQNEEFFPNNQTSL